MQVSHNHVIFMLANVTVLTIIALGEPISREIAYHLGAIYAGIVIGANIALFFYPFVDLRGLSLRDAFAETTPLQRTGYGRFRRGRNPKQDINTVSVSVLSVLLLPLSGDHTLFGITLPDDPFAYFMTAGLAGLLFGMVLSIQRIWFDMLVWQGKINFYAIALVQFCFIMAIIAGFFGVWAPTAFFAVALGSRNITNALVFIRSYKLDATGRVYGLISIGFVLVVPLIYRFTA